MIDVSRRFVVVPTRLAILASAALLASCAGQRDGATESGAAKAVAGKPGWMAYIGGKEVPAPDIELGDPRTVLAIIDEGKNRNQVMDHLRHLTGEIGPRLTGSKRARMANEWAAAQYTKWGLSNVAIEKWGDIPVQFNRGPSSGRVLAKSVDRTEDGSSNVAYAPIREMQFSTPAWTVGTDGPRRGPVFRVPESESEYASIKDKLKGAWLLRKAPPPVGQRGVRGRTEAGANEARDARAKVAAGTKVEDLPFNLRMYFDSVAGFLSTTRDERVWTGGSFAGKDINRMPPEVWVTIRLSDYDFINSRISDAEPIEVEFDLKHELVAGPAGCYNTIAEIPGTVWPDEVVIISAHMDSWDGPGSQGATDNGTGTVVTLEAARILAAVGAKPKRTIRFINYTGEEQGLLGSEGYVEAHMSEMSKVSCAFVDDGGTNYQGGLGCTEAMVPIMAAATAPTNGLFKDEVTGKPLVVNIRPIRSMPRGGSSDHASFNAVGVPGFYWDEVGRADYPYGWHTQNDKYELAIPVYLMQSATNSAMTAYRLACADTLLPREPRPAAPSGETAPRTPPSTRTPGATRPAPAGEAPKPTEKP